MTQNQENRLVVEAVIRQIISIRLEQSWAESREATTDMAAAVIARGGSLPDMAAIAATAALRYADNLIAQKEGRADALGIDPTDRLRSWSGRYDGAV